MRRLLGGAVAAIILVGVAAEEHSIIEAGVKAPDFTAATLSGGKFTLGDFLEKKNVVLLFYPRDFSAGCSRELCMFRDGYAGLAKHDAVVFGISFDPRSSHEQFASSLSVPFDLISDSDKSISTQYGADWPLLPFPKRISVVIDKEGIVRGVFHHEFDIQRHFEDVVRTLERMR